MQPEIVPVAQGQQRRQGIVGAPHRGSGGGGDKKGQAARSGDLDLSGANTVAAGTLTAQAAQKIIHSDARSHAGQLDLTARTLDNRGGELVQTGSGDTALALSGNFDNRNGRFAANSRNLELSAQSFDNTSGRIEHAGAGTLALNAHSFAGSGGHLYSSNVGLDSEPQ